MIKFICDGCCKEIQEEELIKFLGRKKGEGTKRGIKARVLELCDSCYEKIMKEYN